MSQYIVSARKYRPDSFESLIGQDNIVRTLKNSIQRGQLAHAYLFCGPRGVGKTSAARIFAKTINCSDPTSDMEPCGKCESCLSFQEGRSYCIHELDAASNNGVEDIKVLMDQVLIPPQVGRYSVYIIDEVHMLSTAAFNAFLKTLEEPPAHAIFILATTEKHKILPTILSRCQTYDFNRITVPDIVRNLKNIAAKENVTIDDESLHVIARKADGAMRDALTIFDQTVAFCGTDVKYKDVIKNLNVLDYDYCFALVDSFLKNDYSSVLLEFDDILSKGFNAIHFVSALSSHFRDLIVSRSGGLDSLLEFPDSLKKKYSEQAAVCSLQFLYDALAITMQCESGYRQSVNPRLHIEFALMKLSFLNGKGQVVLGNEGRTDTKTVRPKQNTPDTTPLATIAAGEKSVPERQVPEKSVQAKPVSEKFSQEKTLSEKPLQSNAESANENPVILANSGKEASAPAGSAKPHMKKSMLKAGKVLSISNILNESSSVREKLPDNMENGDKMPDDELVMSKWKEFAAEYSDKPRLSNAIASAKVEIKEENGIKIITFFVQNISQCKWIEDKLLINLEGSLCRLLGSTKLKLLVSVLPDSESGKKIYMPEEKAKDLMSKNDEVKSLINDFGLDIK
ncbi:MAG: DNA polymerase III subunit gamma/tau [Bacteroidales bacterium]|jgi:DNA polymerase-3 subunit gamma/tau|nr:DNA polymerase III subunit gamma/tau [Bacteroidales bacterium]MCI1784596.1 DNA polymerase III subunit gamma/tau [Bacteroidales bacterium]